MVFSFFLRHKHKPAHPLTAKNSENLVKLESIKNIYKLLETIALLIRQIPMDH